MKTAIVPFLLLLNILVAVNAQTKDSVILVKDSITVKLPDVYVTSERPLVTVTDDALSFDVPNLIRAKPVNTAFDILGEIPGLVKEGDTLVSSASLLRTLLLTDVEVQCHCPRL